MLLEHRVHRFNRFDAAEPQEVLHFCGLAILLLTIRPSGDTHSGLILPAEDK